MSGRQQSNRRWLFAVDAMAGVVLILAFVVLFVTGPRVVIEYWGEFGNTPCRWMELESVDEACEDLEAELETVNWLGTGQGIRFDPPGVVDESFDEDGYEVEASSFRAVDLPTEREMLIDRLSSNPGTEQVEAFNEAEHYWTTFRHGQVLISVSSNGRLQVNGPKNIAMLTEEIHTLGETMGRVPRPATSLGELLVTSEVWKPDGLLFRGFGTSLLALLVVSVWLLGRAIWAVRRRASRQQVLDSPWAIEEDRRRS